MTAVKKLLSRLSIGHAIAFGSMLVTGPFVFLAIGMLHKLEIPGGLDLLLVGIPAVGLSLSATFGSAYILSTAFGYVERRWVLGSIGGVNVALTVYVIAAFAVAHYTEPSAGAEGHLGSTLGMPGLWLMAVAVVLVPELAAVGSLTAASVRLRKADEVERLRLEIGQVEKGHAVEVESLRSALHEKEYMLHEARGVIDELRLEAASTAPKGKASFAYPPTCLAFLRDAGAWLTHHEVADKIGEEHSNVNPGTVRKTLDRLTTRGVVERTVAERDGKAVTVYACVREGEALPALGEVA